MRKQISSKELNERTRIVGDTPTIKKCNMQFTFIIWVVSNPPAMKNIELKRLDQVFGLVSRIFVGSLGSTRIAKIEHC